MAFYKIYKKKRKKEKRKEREKIVYDFYVWLFTVSFFIYDFLRNEHAIVVLHDPIENFKNLKFYLKILFSKILN